MNRTVRIAAAVALLTSGLVGCRSEETAAPGAALSADESRTLASLREVDDHPLWTMTFHGDYDPLDVDGPAVTPTTFGCSLFAARGNPADPVFGRNFDFDHQPALLLFTDAPDSHASVSMVDVSYLGVTSAEDFTTEEGRRLLLDAPLLPFDGMNDKGLVVGMATVPEAVPTTAPGRPVVGSVRIQRMMLDRAATVDEAIKVFNEYTVDFTGSPPLHYMVADAHGSSAILEFVDGELQVTRDSGPWQAMVNYRWYGSTPEQRQADSRYRAASETLTAAGGRLDTKAAMDLLADVRQGHTQWSIVYGQRTGKVTLTTGQRYGTVHEFTLPMEL
ncbi:linear amide C-N hydrolase [Actinokineospora sp. UTMC 2448]|uniref:linear amide C-N hydrolase n=1 Tax=Actinokineospora sp. UTMC 2448 TaxID=2268449 RepID=UPI002164113B|nr:linear amide C-N hydrolase [Actinokineospora sp. UTMC 2448]UVS78793.1 Penicillin acylase precursor [Actinokineospora sp. UTMC 2448]